MDLTKYYPDIVAKYPAYVTQRELCEICRICPKTAYNLEQQGEIPYTIEQNHLIRSHKIKLTDILAYLYRRECRQEADSPYICAMRTFYDKHLSPYSLNLLQNYVFIPLDIFSQTVHNNGIRNLLEAWLVFLSSDSPELMISLITEYPKFKVMYEHLYYICQNVERMMEMYSAELKILDRNTVQYMVDQMQEATNSLSAEVSMKQEALQSKEQQLEEAHQKIKELQQLLGK